MEGKALFNYLVANKKRLIEQKKAMPIKSDAVSFATKLIKPEQAEKALSQPDDPDTIRVKVVCNAANFCDSQMDVLLPDCWSKTIAERGPAGKNIIPHIHDHEWEIKARIGDVIALAGEMLTVKSLGYDAEGLTQCLCMTSDVRKDYDEKIFALYSRGAVNQHSIGLQYMQLSLAINDPDYKEEFAVWQKVRGQVINGEICDQKGYFWAVSEIKLYENSAVLFGSNELTPTLETSNQPSDEDTGDKHKTDQPKPGQLTSEQIKTRILLTKFIN